PCTGAAGQTVGLNCVPCSGQSGGICTPTEALVVQHDIDVNGIGPTNISGNPNSCYDALDNVAFGLDDPSLGTSSNECEDLPSRINPIRGAPNTSSDVANCLAIISAIFATGAHQRRHRCDRQLRRRPGDRVLLRYV